MNPMCFSSLISLVYSIHSCFCLLPSWFIIFIHNDSSARNSLFLSPSWEKSFVDFICKAYFKYHFIYKAFLSFPQENVYFSSWDLCRPFFSLSQGEKVHIAQYLKNSAQEQDIPVLLRTSQMTYISFITSLYLGSVLFCFLISKIEMLPGPTL